MAEKTDYSPVVEEAGDAEKAGSGANGRPCSAAHLFWIYALILAGIVLLLYLVLR
jgi:hypothetical protein